ncbi:MAG TPA: arylformamidase [Parvularculaceae bacterium]|nr:arylformamidase [Parvularculaceae bacterium]
MALIDISPALSPATPVFPGDTPFSSLRTWILSGDCPVNVSKMTMTTHIGAHADAPMHFINDGAPIDKAPLEPYIGLCSVIDARGVRNLLAADELARRVGEKSLQPRILFRFFDQAPQSAWPLEFPAVGADAVHWLADRGAILVGVDTPSLDPQHSKLMDAHHAVGARNLRILEGLVLDEVDEGDYELIAPPLKLAGLDAAPVRAVLRTRE